MLFIDGLQDISDEVFKNHYPITKKQVQKLIASNYQLDAKAQFFELKSLEFYPLIEDALKFIRGTIEARAVFNQDTFEKEIITALGRVITDLNLNLSYLQAVKQHLKEILLCILCILHDSKFIFHDRHIGTCFLSFYPFGNKHLGDKPNSDSLIALTTDSAIITMPLFISNIKVGDCLYDNSIDLNRFNHMKEIPWINTKRDEASRLVLSM